MQDQPGSSTCPHALQFSGKDDDFEGGDSGRCSCDAKKAEACGDVGRSRWEAACKYFCAARESLAIFFDVFMVDGSDVFLKVYRDERETNDVVVKSDV